MARMFGTDGVRGVANTSELSAELAYRIGQAGAYLIGGAAQHKPKILVGTDTRISCDMLEAAIVAGICSTGADAICLGVIPTPAVAYLIRKYNADAGVVISASHNPFEFNGIKFFNNQGYKLPDEVEDQIEAIVKGEGEKIPLPTGEKIGRRTYCEEAADDYVNFVKNTIEGDLKGLKIAVDCANGASYKVAPLALFDLGAEVMVIHNEPDGININDKCGSTHLDDLKKFVVQSGADVGLAFDGDADRVMVVDEKGNVIDGDQIMAIIALDLRKRGKLKNNTIVATVMSNLGLDVMAKREGMNVVKTKVGDRYVLEEMLKDDYVIGGENSGHIILLEHNTTGDGLVTGLQFLSILKKSGKKASELASVIELFPQVLVNAKVSNQSKYKYMDDPEISKKIAELEAEFANEGRVLIRPSGTEPMVRVMIEGKDQEYITRRAQELAKLIEERLN